MSLLREYIREIINESKLRVFDFDDTLVKSSSRIKVTRSGKEKYITPAEFAIQGEKPEHEYDYSEFLDVIEPHEIRKVTNILRNAIRAGADGRETVILSARAPGSEASIRNYLEDIGIDTSNITFALLGTADPGAKKAWIKRRIIDKNVKDLLFLDDSGKNVTAVQELKDDPDFPTGWFDKFDVRKVSYAAEL